MSCDVEGMEPGRAFEHRSRKCERPPTKSDTHLTRHPIIDEPIPAVTPDDLLFAEHAIQRAARDIGASDDDIALVLDMLGIREQGASGDAT